MGVFEFSEWWTVSLPDFPETPAKAASALFFRSGRRSAFHPSRAIVHSGFIHGAFWATMTLD
jgi:hypothetical protein